MTRLGKALPHPTPMRIKSSNLADGTLCHQESQGLAPGHLPFHEGGGFATRGWARVNTFLLTGRVGCKGVGGGGHVGLM
jgi:hypothetical protein